MNRRTFVEALGALCVSANSPLLRGAGLLNRGLPLDIAGGPAEAGKTPPLVPVPVTVGGVKDLVMSLSGKWQVNTNPPLDFWKAAPDANGWQAIEMPNEFATQGLAVAPNREYPCRRHVSIPAEWSDKRIFVRFDGVYGYARVWINGVYLRDHFGGFTSWDCEITEHVKAGQDADLVVGITDRSDDISQASYYAKHSIAGILREVRLFAVPHTHLSSLAVTVTLDDHYQNGLIHLSADVSARDKSPARLQLKLSDDSGHSLPLEPASVTLPAPGQPAVAAIHVSSPEPWDAEHPNLYTLEVSLAIGESVVETVRRRIGFRSVARVGNQLVVNGRPVKLRGVCRHSIHPIYGRAVPPEFDELDAKLLRAANINFVRTSHYPPSEQFLEACDRHGIYIEEETAVCWSNVEGGPSSDSQFTQRFLSQFSEMLGRDRDHASVLFWSLGNESQWGTNFALEQRFAAEHDSSRPTIFSYPDTAPVPQPFDIYSKHYASVASDLSSVTNPLLNDEFAHISCYNLPTLRRDPGVRGFWGRSIRDFGEKFISSDGCLGGSIWAGIDEIFLLPDGPVGYGPWGVIDGWRRPKPEYWLTQKAYSPIRIEDRPISAPEPGEALAIPVRNAFDHTNFSEMEIRWSCASASGQVSSVDIQPHHAGYLEIPAQHARSGDVLQLDFSWRGALIDQFRLPIEPPPPSLPIPQAAAATLRQAAGRVEVSGPHFLIAFDPATGLLAEARFDEQVVLLGGPYVDFGQGPLMANWLLREFNAAAEGDTVRIHTAGECKQGEGIESIPVEFDITIAGSGLITTLYRIRGERHGEPQLGIAWLLPSNVDKLAWSRDPLWSVYPPDHIARPRGIASKLPGHPRLSYRAKPEWPWSEDVGDSFLWGKDNPAPQACNDFLALKENVWFAACIVSGGNIRARAEGNAEIAARAGVLPDGRVTFSLYNYWTYPDLEWGNYTGPTVAPAVTTQSIQLRLTDLPEES